MIKNYIIDTNVFLNNSDALFHFEDNNVIIPIGVIEELDRFKKDVTELGRNARQTSRHLDDLIEKGDLKEGVATKTGGKISVRYNGNLNLSYKEQNVDLHIINIAQEITKSEPEIPCIIVSRDTNVRIRANALGIKAQNYERDRVNKDDVDKGYSELELSNKNFEEIISEKEIDLEKCIDPALTFPNYYYIIKKAGDKKTILGRVNKEKTKIIRLMPFSTRLPIIPKNKEQNFLFDALLDKDIKLVAIAGKPGSGKTLVSVGIASYMTMVEKKYKRMLVSRPVYPMGKDIGFLPGELTEKLDPWMTPIYDAFDVINDNKSSGREYVKNHPQIVVEPLTYIRGRSIHDQILIVDEAQNLTTLELKTIISRAGENTKIILTGDIHQIDNPYIDSLSNGLSMVIAAFRGSSIATSLVLERCVRSELAEEAADRL